MKKVLGIALVLALAAMLIPSAVFAADPCNMVINWAGGAGLTTGTVTAGSTLATTNFTVLGNNINGTFTADYSVGGGEYGANKYSTSMFTGLNDGVISFNTLRGALGYTNSGDLDPGGNNSYSFIGAGAWNQQGTQFTTGTGTVAMKMSLTALSANEPFHGTDTSLKTNTYYSGVNYPAVGPNDHNFQATGTSAFSIIQSLTAANGNYATVNAAGNGSAYLDCIMDRAGNPNKSTYVGGYALSGAENFAWGQDFGASNGSGLLTIQGGGHTLVQLFDLTQTGADPATSWFASTGIQSNVGSGRQATGTGAAGSCTINQNVGWNTATLGAFTYNRATIQSQ
jgi:hypothetical protein